MSGNPLDLIEDGVGLFQAIGDDILSVTGAVVSDIKKVETIAAIVGDGIIGAADTVGSGVISLGNEAARFSQAAGIGLIDLTKTSAGEIARFAEYSGSEVVHFSEVAFDAAYRGLLEAGKLALEVMRAQLTETLPELEAPYALVDRFARTILGPIYFSSREISKAGGFTVLHHITGNVGLLSVEFGLYADYRQETPWGFYAQYPDFSLDEMLGRFQVGASVMIGISLFHGAYTEASEAEVIKIKASGKIGPITIEGALYFKWDFPPIPVGGMISAGLEYSPSDQKSKDGKSNVDSNGHTDLVEDREILNVGRQLVQSGRAAALALQSPVTAARIKATAQVAAMGSTVFDSVGYGNLIVNTTLALAGGSEIPDPADSSRRVRQPIVGAQGAAVLRTLRIGPPLSGSDGLSIELVGEAGKPSLYLEARDSALFFSPYRDSDSFRRAATFIRRTSPSNAEVFAVQTVFGGARLIVYPTPEQRTQGANTVSLAPIDGSRPITEVDPGVLNRAAFLYQPQIALDGQTSVLTREQLLRVNGYRRSPNGQYFLVLRESGALALCRGSGPADQRGAELWSSPPVVQPSVTMSIGSDPFAPAAPAPPVVTYVAHLNDAGQLGVYPIVNGEEASAPIWQSPVVKDAGRCFAVLTDLGRLAVFRGEPERPEALVYDHTRGACAWPVEETPIALLASNGFYVGSYSDSNHDGLVALSARYSQASALTLVTLCNGRSALRTWERRYVGIQTEGLHLQLSGGCFATENFEVIQLAGGKSALRAQNGRYLCRYSFDPQWVLASQPDTSSPDTQFQVLKFQQDPLTLSGRSFRLRSVLADKPIAVKDDGFLRGTAIGLAPFDPLAEGQYFLVKHVSDGYFLIQNERSELVLQAAADGTAIVGWIWRGTDDQLFWIKPYTDGSFAFISKSTGKALAPRNEAIADDTPLGLATLNDGMSQHFTLVESPFSRSTNALALSVWIEYSVRGSWITFGGRVYMPGYFPAKVIAGGPGGTLTKLKLSLSPPTEGLSLSYQMHYGDGSTSGWVAEGNELLKDKYGLQLPRTSGFSLKLVPKAGASAELQSRIRDYSICYQLYLEDRGLTDVYTDGQICPTGGADIEGIRIWGVGHLPLLIDARQRRRGQTASCKDKVVYLRNKKTGKVLQIAGSGLGSQAYTQADATDGSNQKFWVYYDDARDLFSLFSDHSKQCLSVPQSSQDSGTALVQSPFGGSDSLRFAIIADPNIPGAYLLAAENSGKFLTVRSGRQIGSGVYQSEVRPQIDDTFRWELVPALPELLRPLVPWTSVMLATPGLGAMVASAISPGGGFRLVHTDGQGGRVLAQRAAARSRGLIGVAGVASSSGQQPLFLYDPLAGTGSFHSVSGDQLIALGPVLTGLRKGCKILAGKFSSGGATDFLFYDAAAGEGTFYQSNGSSSLTQLGAGMVGWRKTWQIVPGKFSAGPNTDLLFYDSSTGEAYFYQPNGLGNITPFGTVQSGWRKTWQIISGKFANGPYSDLMLYDNVVGEAYFFRTDGSGNIAQIGASPQVGWRKTWQIVAGRFSNRPFSDLLLHDSATGDALFFNTNGTGGYTPLGAQFVDETKNLRIVVGMFTSGRATADLFLFDPTAL